MKVLFNSNKTIMIGFGFLREMDSHLQVLRFSVKRFERCQVFHPLGVIHINEPRHDKTNKMSVRPAKTQISLGIHPV